MNAQQNTEEMIQLMKRLSPEDFQRFYLLLLVMAEPKSATYADLQTVMPNGPAAVDAWLTKTFYTVPTVA